MYKCMNKYVHDATFLIQVCITFFDNLISFVDLNFINISTSATNNSDFSRAHRKS